MGSARADRRPLPPSDRARVVRLAASGAHRRHTRQPGERLDADTEPHATRLGGAGRRHGVCGARLDHRRAAPHAEHWRQSGAGGLRDGLGRDRPDRSAPDAAVDARRAVAAGRHQPRQRCQRLRTRHRSRRPPRPAAGHRTGAADATAGAHRVAGLLRAGHGVRADAGLARRLADPDRRHRVGGGSDGLFGRTAADLLHAVR